MKTLVAALSLMVGSSILYGISIANNPPQPLPASLPVAATSIGRDSLLEDIPASLVASLVARQKLLQDVASVSEGFGAVMEDDFRWRPGDVITVAFLDGDTPLHAAIEKATRQLTDDCNIKFDFGYNPTTKSYRRWTTADQAYAADIRVAFDVNIYWSLVGQYSTDRAIGSLTAGVGGYPHQRSLILGGFMRRLPANWQRTTRHEFMHALGFYHEHQHPMGTCNDNFRWDDDPGYQNTVNANGEFISDTQNRRPGIYTYLSGPPNNWDKIKTDHNLKPLPIKGLRTSQKIDKASVMMYRFADLYYKRMDSPCVPVGDGEDLSAGDRAGLKELYPFDKLAVNALIKRQDLLTKRVLVLRENMLSWREKREYSERAAEAIR